eukprot:11771774-Prorocentrum_lima.AAC.1
MCIRDSLLPRINDSIDKLIEVGTSLRERLRQDVASSLDKGFNRDPPGLCDSDSKLPFPPSEGPDPGTATR